MMVCYAWLIKDPRQSLVAGLLSSYFCPDYVYERYPDYANCRNSAKKLLESFHDTFVDIVKQSFIKNDLSDETRLKDFKEKYENSLSAAYKVRSRMLDPTLLMSNQSEAVSFCSMTANIPHIDQGSVSCDGFRPTLTARGPCYVFNGLSLKQLYRESPHLVNWDKAFDFGSPQLILSDGFGPTKGLTFILNSFDMHLMDATSLNFILSLSGANKLHDLVQKNYVVEPGFVHTFRVLAKQMTASDALKDLNPGERNCLLEEEAEHLNFSKFYTKSSCSYECSVLSAVEACNCTPWYIPHFENSPYCDLNDRCFESSFKNGTSDVCECPDDCEGTEYIVFKSNQHLNLPPKFCADGPTSSSFPFNVYCELCRKIIRYHRMRLVYDHFVSNATNPDDFDAFCLDFISNHVALVKVEMVSKSVVRSIRDQRYSFMSKISSLGELQQG